MPRATHSIRIEAPAAAIMDVITDFAAYPSFLPEMSAVEVLVEEPDAWEVRFTIQVIRSLTYTLRLVKEGPLSLQWSLLEGVFRSNDGGWTLLPQEDGSTTARYHIDVQMSMYVPGNIVNSLVDRGLPQTMSRFKQEAERRLASSAAGPALPGTAPGDG